MAASSRIITPAANRAPRHRASTSQPLSQLDLFAQTVQVVASEQASGVGAGSARKTLGPAQTAQATAEPSTTPPGLEAPHLGLARRVADQLAGGHPVSAQDLFAEASYWFGGTLAEGAFTPRDAYDAAELGLHIHLLRSGLAMATEGSLRSVVDVAASIEQAAALLPTQTRRTGEQIEHQQFSTPAAYAYLAAWAGQLGASDRVLEPSAGTGSLVTFALCAGADVYANEIGELRGDLLRCLAGEASRLEGAHASAARAARISTYAVNADHLDAVLPPTVQPTVVLMNPPFSRTAGRLSKRQPGLDGLHVVQAMKRLSPAGRLVAIVGHNASRGSSAHYPLYKAIEKGPFALRASVAVDGRVYRKQGTSFDTRVLVIDHVGGAGSESAGRAGHGPKTIEGRAETLEDLAGLLARARALRVLETGTQERPPAREEPAPHEQPARQGHGGDGAANVPMPGRLTKITVPKTAPTRTAAPIRDGAAEAGRTSDSLFPSEVAGPSWPFVGTEPLKLLPPADRAAAGELTAAVFDAYEPSIHVEGQQAHPTPLVESAAMAAAVAPECTYRPHLPAHLVTTGALSGPQLEAICFAGQAHEELLPAEDEGARRRQGFFIGDGTGVGKGRECAGVILDNVIQGRTKALWVTENRSLMRDAVRDWTALGGPESFVFDLGDYKGPIDRNRGVLFASYDTLKGKQRERSGKTVGVDRLGQVVAYLAGGMSQKAREAFDGVIVFDEAHNAQSALEMAGARGTVKPSQRALAVVELQERLPNARVLYVSATGATEVANLAYAGRLGLWGRGTPFVDVKAFVEKVSAGGIAAMELVAKDLKSMGLYLARSVSYAGVDYRTLTHVLSAEQKRIYDGLAKAWQLVLGNVRAALEVTQGDQDGRAKGAAYSQFWGSHQRFFLHVLVAMSAPSLIRDMEARLAAGESCVVQLVSTMEAATERAYAAAVKAVGKAGLDLDDFDVTPRDQLIQYVQNAFPTTLYEEYEDEAGNTRMRPVKDGLGGTVASPEAVRMRDDLVARLGSLAVPHGVLDQVVQHFGPDAVAEVTGRSRRFVERTVDGTDKVVEERRTRRKSDAEVAEFMAGKRRILVFSQAGGTGRSYHADLNAQNQQRRVLYCVEPGWSSARCVQGMGRVHRANQACPPELVLVTTNLKAQRRFLSTIARRLDQLGALTKGQRETASQGLLSADFNLETPLAAGSIFSWFQDLHLGVGTAAMRDDAGTPRVTLAMIDEEMGIRVESQDGELVVSQIPPVPKFLNRLLSLTTEKMDVVFDSWYAYLELATEAAQQAGTLDMGVETLRALEVAKRSEKRVYTHLRTGAAADVVELEVTRRTEIVTWDEVKRRAWDAQTEGRYLGFVQNRKSERVYLLVRVGSSTNAHGGVVGRLRRIGIRGSQLINEPSAFERRQASKNGAGDQPLSEDQARELWTAEVKAAPQTYTEPVYLVTGIVLPIWDRIDGPPRVYRVQTTVATEAGAAEERMIGRLIAPDYLESTLKKLGAEGASLEITPEKLAERLTAGGVATLANGWKLRPRRVAGEIRIEVLGPTQQEHKQLARDGAFVEIHQFRARVFVPTGGKATGVLERITEHRPVIEFATPDAG